MGRHCKDNTKIVRISNRISNFKRIRDFCCNFTNFHISIRVVHTLLRFMRFKTFSYDFMLMHSISCYNIRFILHLERNVTQVDLEPGEFHNNVVTPPYALLNYKAARKDSHFRVPLIPVNTYTSRGIDMTT